MNIHDTLKTQSNITYAPTLVILVSVQFFQQCMAQAAFFTAFRGAVMTGFFFFWQLA